VTALCATMFGAAGREEIPCGNFGTPFIEAVHGDRETSWYALELSSFQLETIETLHAAAAILLNIQADHLDRHGDLTAYCAAKWRIAALRRNGAPLVLCIDDERVVELAERAQQPILRVSTRHRVDRGGCLEHAELTLRVAGNSERLCSVDELPIPGEHNIRNTLAAATACRAVGVPLEAIRRALTGYTALPHRLQEVATVNGVTFVDDSKATNIASALCALAAFPSRHVLLLLGGRDKEGDFAPLAQAILSSGATIITFGEAGELIAAQLEKGGVSVLQRCKTMAQAVVAAHSAATVGAVVLLSPACASFDEFTSFAARGDTFAKQARALAEARS